MSLHIDEKEYDIVTLNNSIPEFNSTNLTRERTETINEQLSSDPDLMNKMFDQLTKTFDDSEDPKEEELKEESEIKYELNDIDDDDNFGVETVAEIDVVSEPAEKKKETIENNVLEQDDNAKEKPDEDEDEDEIVNKPAAPDQKINKKRRGKKK